MLQEIASRFIDIKRKFSGYSHLNEKNIQSIVQDINLALIESDVHHEVIKKLLDNIKQEAIGKQTFKNLNLSESFFKILYQKMIEIMKSTFEIKLKENELNKFIFIGLQGTGKTTSVAKLGFFLKKNTQQKKY